jgi:crotonobetainyl-CoA:carnitine CoA-transferase CaiB-like acyl-CoA transferase
MSHDFPLAGLRVLDAAQGIAGPSAAMMMAQYGAEVIKVEPKEGDWSRQLGAGRDGMTSLAVANNLGKRSIALDLKTPAGSDIFRKLAERTDVLVESFRAGVMERLGFGYAQVTQFNPRIIYLSITGFGQQGPMRAQPATDMILQAFTGMMGVNKGIQDGLPHRLDCWPIDVVTGQYAFQAVAMALYARRDIGQGRYIDASLLQAAAALQSVRILDHVASGGAATVASAFPVGTFRTRDGWINLSVLRDAWWQPFCKVVNRPDWAADSTLATAAGRRARETEIMAGTTAALREQTSEYWCARLREADILNERVNTYAELLAHPQTEATGLFTWIDHAAIGRVPHPNIPGLRPLEASGARSQVPPIGAHTREVLNELGYSMAAIDVLVEEQSVFAPSTTPHDPKSSTTQP